MFRLDSMSLGSRIRHYRKKARWTLEKLSEECGVDVGTISAIENRESQRSKYAVEIAAGFGLTLNQLQDENADYDVPMKPQADVLAVKQPAAPYVPKISEEEAMLLQAYRSASEETRAAMLAIAKSVLQIPDRKHFERRTGN